MKGGLDERELEHKKKRTLFELACPTDDLSCFACCVSLRILWSEYFHANKVVFEALQAVRHLDIFCKSYHRFFLCFILFIVWCIKYLSSLCLLLETSQSFGTTSCGLKGFVAGKSSVVIQYCILTLHYWAYACATFACVCTCSCLPSKRQYVHICHAD